MKDADQVRLDWVQAQRGRLRDVQVVRHRRHHIRMETSPAEFDLFGLPLDSQAEQVGADKVVGQGADARGQWRGWTVVGHERTAFGAGLAEPPFALAHACGR